MNEIISGLGSLVIFAIAVAWTMTFFVIVKQKRATVIEVFGKFFSVKTAGLGIKPPFPLGVIAGTLNLQIQEEQQDPNVNWLTLKSKVGLSQVPQIYIQQQLFVQPKSK